MVPKSAVPCQARGASKAGTIGGMVLVYGTVCLDRLRRVAKLPDKGAYAEIDAEVELLGGEAANTALALATWGIDIALAGNPIGRGPRAQRLQHLLESSGLPIKFVPGSDAVTPVCDIYVTPDGDRTMFGVGFREMEATAQPAAAPYVPGAWFTADPNHGEAAREAVRLATIAGMRIYLLDFVRPEDPIAPGSYWQSSTDWVGVRGNTQRNVQWLRDWVEKHGCYGVLSDGPNGFVAGSPTQRVRAYPPYPAPSVVDSTGAGDTFRAGFLLGLDLGWPLAECLQFASAAGCLSCASLGATSNVPRKEAILQWIAKWPEVSEAYDQHGA